MTDKTRMSRQGNRKITDWSDIRRQVEAAHAALERSLSPSPGEKKVVLKTRAEFLSKEVADRRADQECLEVVEFLLTYERYAVESAHVRTVHPLNDITPLPLTPSFVLGIINVHGQVISVVDIRKFFGLPERGLTDLNKVIILSADDMEFGILADEILGVRSIPIETIQPPLPTLTGIRAEYLKGVTKERLVVLDAVKMLSDKRIVVHEEVEA